MDDRYLFKAKRKGTPRRKDYTNMMFGNTKVIHFSHVDSGGNAYWVCKCGECGKEYTTSISNLSRSKNHICSECKNKRLKDSKTTHNGTNTRLFTIWMGMKSRCCRESCPDYKNYGGRGIVICQEWLDNFEIFRDWALANGYSDNLTIDRKNVDGNYCPENCRWATSEVQDNNKRNSVYYEINGVRKTVSEWSKIYNIPQSLVRGRLKRGINIETALTAEKKKPFGFKNDIFDNPELLEVE